MIIIIIIIIIIIVVTYIALFSYSFIALRVIGCKESLGQMLDCCCYEQHSHENESRTEIRSEPFI